MLKVYVDQYVCFKLMTSALLMRCSTGGVTQSFVLCSCVAQFNEPLLCQSASCFSAKFIWLIFMLLKRGVRVWLVNLSV